MESPLLNEFIWIMMIPLLETEDIGSCMVVCRYLRSLISRLCYIVIFSAECFQGSRCLSNMRGTSEFKLKRRNPMLFKFNERCAPIYLYIELLYPGITGLRTFEMKLIVRHVPGDTETQTRAFRCRLGWDNLQEWMDGWKIWRKAHPGKPQTACKTFTDEDDHRFVWTFDLSRENSRICINRLQISEKRAFV